jgi:hypothetical protein
MTTLEIHRLHARYQLGPAAVGSRDRLDSILARVAGESLREALERHGVGSPGEICVRSVEAPLRVRLDSSDAAIEGGWCDAIAAAIAAAISEGGANAVTYASAAHALRDFARSIADGDLTRAWAWRQLGLWRSSPSASGSHWEDRRDGTAALVQALLAKPESIVPVLADLGRSGRLERLARRVESQVWIALAAAALTAAGATDSVLAAVWRAGAASDLEEEVATTAASVSRSAAISRAAVTVGEGLVVPPRSRFALAVLATLEVDPSVALAAPARAAALVSVVAERLFELAAGVAAAGVLEAPPAGAAAELRLRDEQQEEAPATVDEPAEPSRVEARELARTRWGGLLFFLHVLDELRLPKELALSPSQRPLRWRLHRLALALAPLEDDDPAALAFAGLACDNPFAHEAPPTRDELDEVAAVAHRCVERLAERIRRVRDDRAELVFSVCRREAEIAFDPGWIDVRLRLDDVDLDLRRAGLDLDPGYVPWLGCVVRFVYE